MRAEIRRGRVEDNAPISGMENWVENMGGRVGLKTKMTVSFLRRSFWYLADFASCLFCPSCAVPLLA